MSDVPSLGLFSAINVKISREKRSCKKLVFSKRNNLDQHPV